MLSLLWEKLWAGSLMNSVLTEERRHFFYLKIYFTILHSTRDTCKYCILHILFIRVFNASKTDKFKTSSTSSVSEMFRGAFSQWACLHHWVSSRKMRKTAVRQTLQKYMSSSLASRVKHCSTPLCIEHSECVHHHSLYMFVTIHKFWWHWEDTLWVWVLSFDAQTVAGSL